MSHFVATSLVALDIDWFIRFFQILRFLGRENLALEVHSLVKPGNAAEADDGAGDLGVDPGERDLRHLPPLLVRELSHPLDNLLGRVAQPPILCLAFRPGCLAKLGERPGQVSSS